jgi:hypothetical protein
MLEHITAVCEIELAVRHGQPLTESNPIVDIETGKSGMGDVPSRSTLRRDLPQPPGSRGARILRPESRHRSRCRGHASLQVETQSVGQDLAEALRPLPA